MSLASHCKSPTEASSQGTFAVVDVRQKSGDLSGSLVCCCGWGSCVHSGDLQDGTGLLDYFSQSFKAANIKDKKHWSTIWEKSRNKIKTEMKTHKYSSSTNKYASEHKQASLYTKVKKKNQGQLLLTPLQNLLLWADPIGNQPEVPIWRNERENSFWFPALESNTRMKAYIVQQSWVLWAAKEGKLILCSDAKTIMLILVSRNYPKGLFISRLKGIGVPRARFKNSAQLNFLANPWQVNNTQFGLWSTEHVQTGAPEWNEASGFFEK